MQYIQVLFTFITQ